MPRPALAAETGSPLPLMAAGRASPLRFEGVPSGAATVMEIFRMIAVPAGPMAGPCRPPSTLWASHTGQFFFIFDGSIDGTVVFAGVSLTKKPIG